MLDLDLRLLGAINGPPRVDAHMLWISQAPSTLHARRERIISYPLLRSETGQVKQIISFLSIAVE